MRTVGVVKEEGMEVVAGKVVVKEVEVGTAKVAEVGLGMVEAVAATRLPSQPQQSRAASACAAP